MCEVLQYTPETYFEGTLRQEMRFMNIIILVYFSNLNKQGQRGINYSSEFVINDIPL